MHSSHKYVLIWSFFQFVTDNLKTMMMTNNDSAKKKVKKLLIINLRFCFLSFLNRSLK